MNDLLRLLPPIRRIRGNRLYAADGRRFLDLWLDDGRGILGERDRPAKTFAANAGDKGLLRPYPGLYDARFDKAVSAAWPGFGTIRLFDSEERAIAAAGRALGAPAVLVDAAAFIGVARPTSAASPAPGGVSANHSAGAVAPRAAGTVALARPFVDPPPDIDIAMPRLPCPRPYAPWCLMARSSSAAAAALAAEPGDLVPAQALLAASRALASLGTAAREGYGEALWLKFDKRLGAFFERTGPYLAARVDPARYEAFFRAALEGGALLSPEPYAPSIVPPDFDDGELVKLAKALAAAQARAQAG